MILTKKSIDYNLQTVSVVIQADNGSNRVTFEGVNIVNCQGMVIDNVQLYKQRNSISQQAFF